jgi:hypothetical protein
MMKGSLNDRFLQATTSLVVLIVLVFGYFILENHETSFVAGQILTEQQKAKAIKIALDNSTVQEKMMGKNYSVNSVTVANVGWHNGDDYHAGAYPVVQFTEGTSIYEPDFLIDVAVDMDQGTVLQVMVLVRTPVLRDTTENSS